MQNGFGLKGYFFGFDREGIEKNRKPINIVAAQDGLYEVRETELGVFVAKAPVVPELPSMRECFAMKLPKIPYDILWSILSFFRSYIGEENNEVMAQVFWNREEQRYFIEIPKQKVSGARVDADLDLELEQNHLQVLQIHSHNVMDAFWSLTDNEDEKATMLYAVVGNLDRYYPTIRTRMSVGGKHVEIPTSQVFEIPFDESSVPQDWHQKVTVKGGGFQC